MLSIKERIVGVFILTAIICGLGIAGGSALIWLTKFKYGTYVAMVCLSLIGCTFIMFGPQNKK